MSFLDSLQSNAKAFVGALAGAVISVLQTTATDPDGSITNIELPNDQKEWLTFFVSIAIGFLFPYVKRNFPPVVKAEADLSLAKHRLQVNKQSK